MTASSLARLHDVHGPLGDEAGALGLLPAVLEPLHDERLRGGDLHELDVAVPLAAEEAHLRVGVEQGDQNAERKGNYEVSAGTLQRYKTICLHENGSFCC